jgi:hypothetical protein
MASAKVKALNTINTVLKVGDTGATVAKVCPIKSYPELGGDPEKITVTDMDDEDEASIPGVRAADDMQFTANYTKEAYEAVLKVADKRQVFELDFGAEGADGMFSWTGVLSVKINAGEVNGAREMTLSIVRDSKIKSGAAADEFPSL